MKIFIKLFAIIGLLTGSVIIAPAQDARGLYIAYNANHPSSPSKPNGKPPKPPKKPTGHTSNGNNPPAAAVNDPGTVPTATGLPGTKITIELNRNGKLSFVKPTHKFRSGDKIRLRLQTNFTGYISLLNVSSTGEIQFLYPFEGANNKLSPSSDLQIPASEAWIVFDDKTGTESLTVIMSKVPLGESPDNYQDIRQSSSRDLLISYADDGIYAVCEEDKISKPVGFTLKLKHS